MRGRSAPRRGIDLATHAAPDPLEMQQRFLADVVDPGLASFLAIYEAHGALDGTLVVLVGDHGHAPVSAEGSIPHRPREVLDAAGFTVRPAELEVEGAYDAVLALNGGLAHVYLADRSRCDPRCDWHAPPRLDEDVLPAARALARSMEDELDLALVRAGEELYVVAEGRLVPLAAWLAEHPRADLPRFEERLRALTRGPHARRAGDVLLFSRTSPRFRPHERTYFARPTHSIHGGASTLESVVPLVVLGPRADGEVLRALVEGVLLTDRSHARTTDVVLRLLEPRARAR